MTYLVINIRTGDIVARCKTLTGARRSRDRRDNGYGAYVHRVQAEVI